MHYKAFNLKLTYNKMVLTGTVRPISGEPAEKTPLGFQVVLNGRSSGKFSRGIEGWVSDSETDQGLVDAVGKYIDLYY